MQTIAANKWTKMIDYYKINVMTIYDNDFNNYYDLHNYYLME